MMRSIFSPVAAVVLLLLATGACKPEGAHSGADPALSEQARRPGAEVALFSVPDTGAAAVKQLMSAIADKKGTIKAEVKDGESVLAVTFTPGETNPHELLAAFHTVETAVTFVGVKAADGSAGAHDCGSCPMKKKSCGLH